MGSTPQKNSFVTIAEQISLMNKNSAEIITKLNDIVTSSDSTVSITQTDSNNVKTTVSLPTVGKLQSQITELNNNLNRLAGLNDNNSHIINGKSTKRIYQADLNIEPNRIERLDVVSKFSQTNNWFFESLMNPMLSVNFDMTNKVGSDVDGVLSRRYIVEFERDSAGVYTTKGEAARFDFVNKFVGKSDINLKDFIDWMTKPTNTGVVRNLTPTYDEQYFNFEYQEITESGTFSVIGVDNDTVNNKMWYKLNTYTYSDSLGKERVLKIGDELILNKMDSTTRWKIIEVSNATSEFRVRLERIEGNDVVPVGADTLKYYGTRIVNKNVKVTFGFDEHIIIFMKPLNGRTKVKGSVFSKGTGLYTNDLVLDSDDKTNLSQFYVDNVYDYGELIRDMIKKNIPSTKAIKPDAPILDVNNFKVVQINKHLTNTTDTDKLSQLNSQKNSVKSGLEQTGNAITSINQSLATKIYSSESERNADVAELTKLITQQSNFTTQLGSITTQIKSFTNTVSNVSGKYRVRGFWDFPVGKTQAGYKTQEVIQFYIEYRYASKSGVENPTESYNLNTSSGTTTAYFSNWNNFKTDLRKRVYDETTQTWSWLIENVADADTPNINQLDIPIEVGETVQFRIKSISEVGDTQDVNSMSDFSEILTIDFPDNLKVTDSSQFILQEAQLDGIKSDFTVSLGSMGVTKHVSESFFVNEKYISHNSSTIQTDFKDTQGNSYNLKDYLDYLTNKITNLENIINSAKGVLKVTIFDGKHETIINNNSETTINVVLQDYATIKNKQPGIYKNFVSTIKDFNLKIENLSTSSDLSFLLKDSYSSGTTVRDNDTYNLASIANTQNNLLIQEDGQWIYFCDSYNNVDLYSGATLHTTGLTFKQYVESTEYNVGLGSGFVNPIGKTPVIHNISGAVSGGTNWDWSDGISNNITTVMTNGKMGTTIVPVFKSIDELKPKSTLSISNTESITIPLNIFWVFKTSNYPNGITLANLEYTEHKKSIRVRLNPSSLSVPFEFVVNFNIQNKRL